MIQKLEKQKTNKLQPKLKYVLNFHYNLYILCTIIYLWKQCYFLFFFFVFQNIFTAVFPLFIVIAIFFCHFILFYNDCVNIYLCTKFKKLICICHILSQYQCFVVSFKLVFIKRAKKKFWTTAHGNSVLIFNAVENSSSSFLLLL